MSLSPGLKALALQWRDLLPAVPVIGNGIDLGVFRPATGGATEPFVFWSGRIVPEKGLHFAIEAARFAGFPLHFAGQRNDRSYWHSMVEPCLGPDIVDLGHLDHRALAKHLAAARVAVVTPCWEEPFGLVIAEALACGTPVASFARGAIPDILPANCGVLAPAGDAMELSRAILAADTLDRRRCRAHAEAAFDVERMTDAYEACYRALLADRSSARPEAAMPLRDPVFDSVGA